MAKQYKKNNLSKTEKYWENLALILEHMKRFKKAVLEARKEWNIPNKGLPFKNRANWYSSLFVNSDIDRKEHLKQGRLFELLPPNTKIINVLENFSKEFNLDPRWYNTLMSHIAAGTRLNPPYGKPYIQPLLNDVRLPENQWEVKRISVDIYKETKPQDLIDIWPQIERWQKLMKVRIPEKRRPIQDENVKKYLKIRRLEDHKLTHNQIVSKHHKLGFRTDIDVANFKKEIEERFAPNRK